MYKYNVYVNEEFTDKYSGKLYSIGTKIEGLSEERVNEINAVSKTLISVISKELVKSEEQIAKDKEFEDMKKELEQLKATKEKSKATKDQKE